MRPLAVAHRGDPLAFRENTLPAFAAAVRGGADMVEIDVRRTADGAAAVVHDRTFERLWGDPRACAELSLVEIRALGTDGCRVPELSEVLAAVAAPLMVDFEDEDVVEPALAAIRDAGALARVLFSGDNVAGHRRVRALAPGARIALTWNEREPPPGSLLDELAVEYFNPPWELLEPGVVEAMHERGTRVSTWTVDAVDTMRAVLDLGVDAVITNRIGSLVSLLGERDGVEAAPC